VLSMRRYASVSVPTWVHRIARVAKGLDKSSRLLRYSDDECGEDCDAFSRFRAIVTAAWLLLEHPAANFTGGKVARVALQTTAVSYLASQRRRPRRVSKSIFKCLPCYLSNI
jgi:hypothetical protein